MSDQRAPRFSVVIPCFNQGMYIAECLQSVLAQTYPAHEIVVVDDGSSDPYTPERLRELCVPPIRLLRQENRGASAARNAGVRLTTGDWILPLDADDKLAPEALAAFARAIAERPGVDVWYPDIRHFGLEDSTYLCPEPNLWRELTVNAFPVASAIRRVVFDAGVWFDESMRRGYEDWEFYIHACCERGFRADNLRTPVLHYRKWAFSTSSRAAPIHRELCEEIRSRRPLFRDDAALLALKRAHSPFFSVASRSPRLEHSLAAQSFRDWAMADTGGRVVRDGDLSAFRGHLGRALLVSLDDESLANALDLDRFLLDKVARVVESHDPTLLWLALSEDADGAYPGFLARPSDTTPPLRGAGFVLPLDHVFWTGGLRSTPAGLLADLDAAARRVEANRILSLVVGSAVPAPGFDIPRPPIVSGVGRVARLDAARLLQGAARRTRNAIRAFVGERHYDRLRTAPAARVLRRAARPSPSGAAPHPPVPNAPTRAGPVTTAELQDSRRASAIRAIGGEPAFRPAGPEPTGPGILIAAPWVVFGGADRALLDLLRGMSEAAPQVRKYLVTTIPTRMNWAPEALRYLEGIFGVPDHGPQDPSGFLLELARSLRIDTFLVENSQVGLDAIPALKRSGGQPPRIAVHVHGFEVDPQTGAVAGHPVYAASHYDGLIDQYIAISSKVAATLTQRAYVSPSRIKAIRVGIDVARFADARRERFRSAPLQLLWLGRLSEEKDPMVALQVGAEVKRRFGVGRVRIAIAGGGPLEPQLRRECRRLGLAGVVDLLGATSDPLPLYACADALLMTSRYEGIPVVVYEAMAAAMPVIAPTRNTSIPEVLTAEDAFFIADQKNAVEYAEAIAQLLANPALGRERAARMARRAQLYGIERYAAEMLDALLPSFTEKGERRTG